MKLLNYLLLILLFSLFSQSNAQVGIGTTSPNASSILDLNTTSKGLLVPRLNTTQMVAIASPVAGMVIYNTDSSCICVYEGTNWINTCNGVTSANTLDLAYDQGGKGAGRIITADSGAVLINGVDGLQVTGTIGSGEDLALSGAGTKMFFYPKKAAFRAGHATGNRWNNDSIGTYSFSGGAQNTASGLWTTALGYNIRVTGTAAFGGGTGHLVNGHVATAFGGGNVASGGWSFATGLQTYARGDKSFTGGESSFAEGDFSFAFGDRVQTLGDYSAAFGQLNYTHGNAGFASGIGLVSTSLAEAAFGQYNDTTTAFSATAFNTNDKIFSIGNGTSNAARSNALVVYKSGNTVIKGTLTLTDGTDSLVYPNTDGTSGQVLTTDGTGALSWSSDSVNTLDLAYDQGGKGAGRIITADSGAVLINGEDGFQVTGTNGSGEDLALSGAGTKMFFYPKKAAFRAGSVTGANWDEDSLGLYSFAGGHNNKVTSLASAAFGDSNSVSSPYSFSAGRFNNSIGYYSTSLGYSSNSFGTFSLVQGFDAEAIGAYSRALGYGVISPSRSETVIGQFNDTSGFISTSIFDTLDRLFTVGNGTTVSSRSNAFEVYKSGKATLFGELSLTDGSDVLVYPNTDGINGQVLTTDGTGALNWSSPSNAWNITGNTGTSPATNFLGTTDDSSLVFKVNNEFSGLISNSSGNNTHFGYQAGKSTTGAGNTFIGHIAGADNTTGHDNSGVGYFALHQNTIGNFNTAMGNRALTANVGGDENTALGYASLYANTSGTQNSGVGMNSLLLNTTGQKSVALGYATLYNNTTGSGNTAVGSHALRQNTTRSNLVAVGDSALFNNGTGATLATHAVGNTAIGSKSMLSNTTGNKNTANGFQSLYSNTTGLSNVAVGYQSMYSITTGGSNVAIGNLSLSENILGRSNTALGNNSMGIGTTGSENTAAGFGSLNNNTANDNSAFGYRALQANTSGIDNAAFGSDALWSNSTGDFNTALGMNALRLNSTASNNTAVGYESLENNSTGSSNTATGYQTLAKNSTGNKNGAFGNSALSANTTGFDNSAFGLQTMENNTVGSQNAAVGNNALFSNTKGTNNTAVGYNAGYGTDSSFNSTFLGYNSYLTTARDNVTMLGASIANGQITADNQLALGNTAITSIRAQVTSITAYSDARYKSKVKEDIKGLDFITKLRPVSYNVRPTELHKIWGTPDSVLNNIDHSEVEKTRYTGLIAQEVEKAAKASGYDFTGIEIPKNDKEAYALKYTEFIMPMIKAIQEQNVEVENLEAKIKLMEAENARIKKEKEDLEQRLLNIEKALEELK